MRPGVEREHRQHTAPLPPPRRLVQRGPQTIAVRLRVRTGLVHHELGALRPQPVQDRGRAGPLGQTGRHDRQPGSGQRGTGVLRQPLPVDAVRPRVQGLPQPFAAPPVGEDRQRRPEGGAVPTTERHTQRVKVTALDDLPEPRLGAAAAAVGHGRGGRGVEPVALPLEGVGGQVDRAGARPDEERRPVERDTPPVQPAECRHDGRCLLLCPPQRRYEHRVAVEGFGGHGGEDGVGAELQVGGDAEFVQCPYRVGEADGLADVVDPVVGGEDLVPGGLAGEGGDDRDMGCGEGEPGDDLAEVVEHRVHERRVEGVGDGELLGPAALFLDLRHDLQDDLFSARDDHRGRPVDGGDRHPVAAAVDEVECLVLGEVERGHGSARGKGLHEAPACGHQLGRVGEGEDAGDVGGGDLADGVSGEVVGAYAPGLVEAEEGDLDGEEGGLGPARVVQTVTCVDDFGE